MSATPSQSQRSNVENTAGIYHLKLIRAKNFWSRFPKSSQLPAKRVESFRWALQLGRNLLHRWSRSFHSLERPKSTEPGDPCLITYIFSLARVPATASIDSINGSRVGRLGSLHDEFPGLAHRIASTVDKVNFLATFADAPLEIIKQHMANHSYAQACSRRGSTSLRLKPAAFYPSAHFGRSIRKISLRAPDAIIRYSLHGFTCPLYPC